MNYKHALSTPIFEIISKSAEQLGFDSYAIGGFVRDFILGRDAKKDIDIVAIGSGIELVQFHFLSLQCLCLFWHHDLK